MQGPVLGIKYIKYIMLNKSYVNLALKVFLIQSENAKMHISSFFLFLVIHKDISIVLLLYGFVLYPPVPVISWPELRFLHSKPY